MEEDDLNDFNRLENESWKSICEDENSENGTGDYEGFLYCDCQEERCPKVHKRYFVYKESSTSQPHLETGEPSNNIPELVATENVIPTCSCGNKPCTCGETTRDSWPVCSHCTKTFIQCTCKDINKFNVRQRWPRPDPPAPLILEPQHPLMRKFQESLHKYLERENDIVLKELLIVSGDLKKKTLSYDKELEAIYIRDHDTNQQKLLLEEYEAELNKSMEERISIEAKAKELTGRRNKVKQELEQDSLNERQASEELQALNMLCRQFQEWQQDTESGLVVNQRVSEKMKVERKTLASEKRELDMIIYRLQVENWHLESEMDLYEKQLGVKSSEMETVRDKIADHQATLEGLAQEKKRLMMVWNSLLINIQQRDKIFGTIKEDYLELQENYRTVIASVEAIRKATAEEIRKNKEIAMNKDRLDYEMSITLRQVELITAAQKELQTKLVEISTAVEIVEKDYEIAKSENVTWQNYMKLAMREHEKISEVRVKLESEILVLLQERLTHDKAAGSTAATIKAMRNSIREQEVNVMVVENQHAKVMLNIEIQRVRNSRRQTELKDGLARVAAKEAEADELQEQVRHNLAAMQNLQREYDIVTKKLASLASVHGEKSPQEVKTEQLEKQIQDVKDETEELQQHWLRLQGHVVTLNTQLHKCLEDINTISKQLEICEHKWLRVSNELETSHRAAEELKRVLATHLARLQLVTRRNRDCDTNNKHAITHNKRTDMHYGAALQEAELELYKLDDELEELQAEKQRRALELHEAQREALVWQRKGIMAAELKKNIAESKSEEGDIYQMKSEIQKMRVRRGQLHRTAERLSQDLSMCLERRSAAADRARALASGASARDPRHVLARRIRCARDDRDRVHKEIQTCKKKLKQLWEERDHLEQEIDAAHELSQILNERIAAMQHQVDKANIQKQWNLERIVRSQRYGCEYQSIARRPRPPVMRPEALVIQDHKHNRDINLRLLSVVKTLMNDFPGLEYTLMFVFNTLNIKSPLSSPRVMTPT